MSEENTSEPGVIAPGPKTKDPRRVAAGKKLASISKQAKEEKALRLKEESETKIGKKTLCVVGGLVVITALSYLLFKNKEKVTRTFFADKKEPDTTPEQEQPPPPPTKKANFKSFFDD